VHVPDPLSPDDSLVEALAATLAPRNRVLSLQPRGASPYQVDAGDLLEVLDQFGFLTPVLVAERLGCVPALLLAAWHPQHVAGLVLVDPTSSTLVDGVEGRALRDCPPDLPSLRAQVQCPVSEVVPSGAALAIEAIQAFVNRLTPDP
jgi:pimeloyl-ACP methyl ester carboxylesterase